MSDTNKNPIVEKIKKLLALGTSSFAAEAELALQKAQEIALAHKIDLLKIKADATKQNEKNDNFVKKTLELNKRVPIAHDFVCLILIRFFDVLVLTTGSRDIGKRIVVLGTEQNVDTAIYLYGFLTEAMDRCWNQFYKSTPGIVLQYKKSYFLGFYQGLNQKLSDNQIKIEKNLLTTSENKNNYAVAVATKKEELTKFQNKLFGKVIVVPVKSNFKKSEFSQAHGFQAGKKLEIHKAITA
jgi:hypothetical protein